MCLFLPFIWRSLRFIGMGFLFLFLCFSDVLKYWILDLTHNWFHKCQPWNICITYFISAIVFICSVLLKCCVALKRNYHSQNMKNVNKRQIFVTRKQNNLVSNYWLCNILSYANYCYLHLYECLVSLWKHMSQYIPTFLIAWLKIWKIKLED